MQHPDYRGQDSLKVQGHRPLIHCRVTQILTLGFSQKRAGSRDHISTSWAAD